MGSGSFGGAQDGTLFCGMNGFHGLYANISNINTAKRRFLRKLVLG
jgi:hypothetical protein